MKNIHLIPTDKPSRLHKFGDCFDTNAHLQKWHNDAKPEYYNIYITNSEEIKEGDWCYYLNSLGGGNIVCQAYKHSGDKRMLFDNGRHNRKIGEGITPLIGECKKIILTTDPTLIADGVQAIDDEFLEWFVKNPSCEEIEVKRGYLGMGGFVETNEPLSKDKMEYKIIIPIQEHPKQIKCYCGHTTYCDCSPLEEHPKLDLKDVIRMCCIGNGQIWNNHDAICGNCGDYVDVPKQETVEEVAERLYPINNTGSMFMPNRDELNNSYKQEGFIEGYKLAQERSYSEEEVIKIVEKSRETGLTAEYLLLTEQFKKK